MPQGYIANSNKFGYNDQNIIKDVTTRIIEIIEQEDNISDKNIARIKEAYMLMKAVCKEFNSDHKNMLTDLK